MRIDAVELRQIEMTLRSPFETSFGREQTLPAILVRVQADGLEGWGEAPTGMGGLYNEETHESVWAILERYIIPPLLGREMPSLQGFARQAARIRRNHMAKAAVEAALWDLEAQRRGKPLAALLGGERERIVAGVSVGIEPTVDELLDRVDSYLRAGYRRIKIKIKPGFDVEPVRRIRERFGDILLQVDANSAYSLSDAATFEALDAYNLLLIEQPLAEDDLVDHAKLQARLRTPICLDESIVHARAARAALELGSCRVINIKPARVGGLWEAVAIHDLCRSRGIPVWCGGMLETGIGRAANLALASLPGFTLPGDLSASDRYFEEDLIDPPVTLNADGTITVPTSPGLGVRVVPERVERRTVRKARYTA
ncbi:MAG: o-succinylbenzoate synthase [Armatimonadota bacterium]|nr:o-succinylbenzoate synthase [Armatimonadota bacterium]MDR7519387.1 o-succinylbenzoate synthase [Armatimonadota bacterium]MDR7549583.1 o-succinylbenzoate synthase [Armatimonadota bacterium]